MARRAGGSGSQKAAFCSETISQWSYHSTPETHVSTLQLRAKRPGVSSSRAILQPRRVSRFRHWGVRAADWTTLSQVTVLTADDDCVGSPMWRVICQRGPKQSGVDVPGDVSDNGCAAGTSPRKRSPVPLRTVSGRAIARPWHLSARRSSRRATAADADVRAHDRIRSRMRCRRPLPGGQRDRDAPRKNSPRSAAWWVAVSRGPILPVAPSTAAPSTRARK